MLPPSCDPFWGAPRLSDELRNNRIKGNLVLSRARYVRSHAGAQALEQLTRSVPPASAELLRHPPAAFAWCDIGPLFDIDFAIHKQIMQSRTRDMRALGAEIAAYDLNTVYRLLIRIAVSPRRMFERLPGIYGEYFQCGQLTPVETNDGGGTLRLEGAVIPPYLCQHGFPGWIETALKLTGAQAVWIDTPSCRHVGDRACSFAISWR